jgi:hypothetical protein
VLENSLQTVHWGVVVPTGLVFARGVIFNVFEPVTAHDKLKELLQEKN